MANRSVVPFGPQHPVLPEPIHLDLVMEDESVYRICAQRAGEPCKEKRFQ